MKANGWRETTIDEFVERGEAEIKTGPFGTQLHASDYVDAGTPVINVRNIGFGSIRPDKLEYISDETVSRLSSHLLRCNDLVFGRKGAVERHVFIQEGQDGWFQGSDCLRLRITGESVNPRFLSYCFLRDQHQKWMMQQCSHGATMASLNQDIIKRIPVNLPSRSEQDRIVDILAAYDDLLENNQRRIQILEEMAQNLYREWFVTFRFPGHQHVKMIDSPLGKIPEGWAVTSLADSCDLVMGQSPKSEYYNETGDGLPFHQGVTHYGHRYPYHKTFTTVLNRVAEEGDILFSVRAPVGRINLADTRLVVGRGLSAIRNRSGFQWFTYHQLKERFQVEDSIGGGTIYKSVTKHDMETIPYLMPSEHAVKQFGFVVSPMSDLIKNLIYRNRKLTGKRDLLLQILMKAV